MMEGHDGHDHSMHHMDVDMPNPHPAVVTDNAHDMMAASHSHNNSAHGGMMSMFFHFGIKEVILFDFWRITSIVGLIGSCVGIFLLAALYEGLKVLREYLMERSQVAQMAQSQLAKSSQQNSRSTLQAVSTNQDSPSSSVQVRIRNVFKPHPFSLAHFCQTGLHMLQIVISYFLMLIFMTYNIWLCLAVVLGAGAGYFALGWRKRTVVDLNEHCH